MFSLRSVWFVPAFAWLVTGCGSASNNATPSPPKGGTGTKQDAAASPEAGAPLGPPGTVTRDSTAGASDPTVAYAVTMTMTSFTVPAGAEVYKCQDFANPFGADAVDIKTWKAVMNPGSHHMTLFDLPGGTLDGPVIDCPEGGLMTGVYSFGAQTANATFAYPDGVGAAIPAGMGFTMNSHYINAGTASLEGGVAVTMLVAAPGVVTQHAGALQTVLLSIDVPPSAQPVTVGSTCTLPQDMNVFAVAPHMHFRASHFVSKAGGMTLYTTDQWEDTPPAFFSPPLQLKSGSDFSWSCDYTNETSQPLSYGASALTNVMCNAVVAFYPIADVNNPLLTCAK